jgi:DNA-binding SARP family transcriptional activator
VRPADDNVSSDYSFPAAAGQRDNTLALLRLIQDDYQGTRKQLEQVSLHLAEKEALLERQLKQAYLASRTFQPLCLVEYKVVNPVNQLGRTILGGTSRPPDMPVSPRIFIRCLGRFDVRSDFGQVKRWRSVKAKTVFQYLLIRPREPTIKEMIMEALWPECSPQAAANNLKVAIHQLKLTLSDLGGKEPHLPNILFLQGSYAINPETNLWIDVEEFEKHWTAGRRLEKNHHLAEAMQEYDKAEALYQGDYLDEEIYQEWTILRRETLKDIYLVILSKLAGHGILINDLESCIHYSQKMLSQDNCHEDAYRWLMYCYARSGQKNRALRWYEVCCRVIRIELGTEPDKRTTELYRSILRDEETQPVDRIIYHPEKLIQCD